VRYDKDLGALGLVLNRPGTEQARPLTSPGTATLSEPPVVFAGGPVLHEGYIQLALLGATATPPVRFFPVAGRLGTIAAPPAEDAVELLRLFRGYLGWGPGELEADLAAGVLVPTDAGFDEAFSSEPEELWHRLRATG